MNSTLILEKKKILYKKGFILQRFPLNEFMLKALFQRNWKLLDHELTLALSPEGSFRQLLLQFADFSHTEHILSIRDSSDPYQEEGIWHDDGSRHLAFSLSLTPDHENIRGGKLEFRSKGERSFDSLSTPLLGTALIFLTGTSGYEHRTQKVLSGVRLVAAGWCF